MLEDVLCDEIRVLLTSRTHVETPEAWRRVKECRVMTSFQAFGL
jgi:hypothetical protein